MATDKVQKVKEMASAALSDLSTTVGTHRQIRGLQRKITDLVSERDRVMLEIGRKVFALYGRDKVRNADIIPLCERIEKVTEAVAGLNEEVQELSKPKPKGELEEATLEDETEIAEDDGDEEAAEEDVKDEAAAEEDGADEDGGEADEETE